MKNLNNNKKGVSLVAAIIIMLMMSILGLTLASLLGTTSRGALDYLRSAQALSLAQAGLNWYMTQLTGTADWDTAANQTGVSLSPDTFDVAVSNKASPQSDSITATRMDIAITGKVAGSDGATIQRTMSQQAWKLPSAVKFALFWGRRTGTNLTLTNTLINGDYWSQGTTNIPASSSISNGIAFRPSTEDITGAGSYSESSILYPYFSDFAGATATFSMPPFNTAYYTGLISAYTTLISGSTTITDIDQNTDLNLTGNTIDCRDFNTNTTAGSAVTISGHGFILANRDINLNTAGAGVRTLTISPSGGNIVFMAGRDVQLNSGSGSRTISVLTGTRIYSTQDLTVNNDNTDIDGALLLSTRRIQIQNSADLTGSALFVNDQGVQTNNYLIITDTGTNVGTLAAPCSVISIGRLSPSLRITGRPTIFGLVYQNHPLNLGGTNIAGANSANRTNITGCLIISHFAGNDIDNANITYNAAAIPDPPPEGFDGFATKKPDSWSGN